MKKLVTLGLAVSLLAGCSETKQQVAMVQNLQPVADQFYATLHRDFSILSKFEYEGGDVRSAGAFAKQAEAAAAGQLPAITDPATLNIKDAESVALLQEQYDDIVARLATEERNTHPLYMSKAITNYECRVEQLEEGIQPDHVLACGNHIASPGEAREQMIEKYRSQSTETRVVEERLAPVPVDFTIYFPFDKDKIVGEGLLAVEDIVTLLNYKPSLSITLVGHADRSGGDIYNVGLSQRRAKNARAAILARGISPARVAIEHQGERVNAKITEDNVREGYNRRVEVEFSEPEIEIGAELLERLRLNDTQPIGQ